MFLTTILVSFSDFLMDVSSGWLVLDLTDSPLSLGLFFAVRSFPNLLFGMVGGAVTDKMDRRQLLMVCYSLYSIMGVTIGYLISTGSIMLWHALILIFTRGVVRTFEGPARQSFIVDIVGRENAMNGISINAIGMRGAGILSGVAAGILIDWFGEEWPFYTLTIVFAVGFGIIASIQGVTINRKSQRLSVWTNLVEGFRIVKENRVVLILMIMASTCEMFGFSFMVLVPVFARDVLKVGAVGMGMINAFRSGGGLIAGFFLSTLGDFKLKGKLTMLVYMTFGMGLIMYANSHVYPMALAFIGIVGISAAAHDAMSQILLQLNVEEDQRGRSMGIWQLSIGFGVVGTYILGVLAENYGVIFAQSLFGVIMVIIILFIYFFMPKLKEI
jgi:MFS family permease